MRRQNVPASGIAEQGVGIEALGPKDFAILIVERDAADLRPSRWNVNHRQIGIVDHFAADLDTVGEFHDHLVGFGIHEKHRNGPEALLRGGVIVAAGRGVVSVVRGLLDPGSRGNRFGAISFRAISAACAAFAGSAAPRARGERAEEAQQTKQRDQKVHDKPPADST